MTRPNDTRVTIRLEVVVEGGVVSVQQTTPEPELPPHKGKPVPYKIDPFPPNTVVVKIGPDNCVAASGTSPVIGGHFANRVWARAFPDPTILAGSQPTPALGSVSDVPVAGVWTFTQAKGNLVPGAACDSISGGPVNSTILVWYEFGGSNPFPEMDVARFHGFSTNCGGSGPAPAPAPGNVFVGQGSTAAPLFATFTGTLAFLGTVSLCWNGASWVGESCGVALAFVCLGSDYHLICAGPNPVFSVVAAPSSFNPFTWAATGNAFGGAQGQFHVVVTE